MNQEIKVRVNMKTNNMYDFLFHHTYSNASGIVGVLLSLVALVYLLLNLGNLSNAKIILLILGALLFTVINPGMLYVKAAQQVKLSPMFKDTLCYILNQEGITVEQAEQQLVIKWEEVQKVIETKQNIIIYVSKVSAFILPKDAFEEYGKAVQFISENVDKKKCKWKK